MESPYNPFPCLRKIPEAGIRIRVFYTVRIPLPSCKEPFSLYITQFEQEARMVFHIRSGREVWLARDEMKTERRHGG